VSASPANAVRRVAATGVAAATASGTEVKYDPSSPTQRRALASALIAGLTKAGFLEDQARSATEERVFTRGIEDTRGKIVVYTTIRNDAVRDEGSDAIRVAGVVDEKGVYKNKPVHRTGTIQAIVNRTLERARETWAGVRDKYPVKQPNKQRESA
jgi:hypothetical protein